MEGNQLDPNEWVSLSEDVKMAIISTICRDFNSAKSFESYLWENNMLYPYGLGHARWELIPPTTPDEIKKSIRDVVDFSKILRVSEIVDVLNGLSLREIATKIKSVISNKDNNGSTNRNYLDTKVTTKKSSINWKDLGEWTKKDIVHALSGNFETVMLLEEYLYRNNILNNRTWSHDNWSNYRPETQEQKLSSIRAMLNFPVTLKLTDLANALHNIGRPNITELIDDYITKTTDQERPTKTTKVRTPDVPWYRIDMTKRLDVRSIIATNSDVFLKLGEAFKRKGRTGPDEWYALSRAEGSTKSQSEGRVWKLIENAGSKGMTRDELIQTLRDISCNTEADLIEELLQ